MYIRNPELLLVWGNETQIEVERNEGDHHETMVSYNIVVLVSFCMTQRWPPWYIREFRSFNLKIRMYVFNIGTAVKIKSVRKPSYRCIETNNK